MLPKPRRLTKDKEFQGVFTKGRAVYTDIIGVKCAKNGLKESRFGIIAGLKVSKKATVRNKIKRRVRQILIKEMGGLKSGYDCVIICRPAIIDKKFDEIGKNLRYLFSRQKFYKKGT